MDVMRPAARGLAALLALAGATFLLGAAVAPRLLHLHVDAEGAHLHSHAHLGEHVHHASHGSATSDHAPVPVPPDREAPAGGKRTPAHATTHSFPSAFAASSATPPLLPPPTPLEPTPRFGVSARPAARATLRSASPRGPPAAARSPETSTGS